MNVLLHSSVDDVSQIVSRVSSSEIEELLVVAESLAENDSAEVHLETTVRLFTLVGDVAADGLCQDEVKSFATETGTVLQVMAPSSGTFSNAFALGPFTIPPFEDTQYQNATLQVISWANNLVDFHDTSAMVSITARKNRENVALRNLDPPLQFVLALSERITVSASEEYVRRCMFWNDTLGNWSGHGLQVGRANLTQVGTEELVRALHLVCFVRPFWTWDGVQH